MPSAIDEWQHIRALDGAGATVPSLVAAVDPYYRCRDKDVGGGCLRGRTTATPRLLRSVPLEYNGKVSSCPVRDGCCGF